MEEIKRYHLRLLVDNFEECFRFYRDILELPVRYGSEDAAYAEFKTKAVHFALFSKSLMAHVAGTENRAADGIVQDRVAIVLRVDDVDQAFEKLHARGVRFDTRPEDRQAWGCRTALFRDPGGNLFELNADLPMIRMQP